MSNRKSAALFARAKKKIPGGVNSPVRAWKAVGGTPKFITRGAGAYVFDADNKKYIDFVSSWGPLILGHGYPELIKVVEQTAKRGTTFGAPTNQEVELAERVAQLFPSIQKLRLVSSGTEATMSAIRMARAYTDRPKIIKFDGCYHGHSDGMLVKAGSGIATLALPDSPGVPKSIAQETLIARFNDIGSVQQLFSKHRGSVAAIIVEPICGNMGVIPPSRGFLAELRELTRRHEALLIFDEVITGFRVARGGAQELYKIKPDLTCLGKILGGGLPLAAFGGADRVMNLLAPQGPVYQAGTLSGNPVAVAAGLKTLELLVRPGIYQKLERSTEKLARGFSEVIRSAGLNAVINRVGSMLTLFFGVDTVTRVDQARLCDRAQFARFFHHMLEMGIYWPPAQFEAAFVSLAHSDADINKTVAAFENWVKAEMRR